MSWNVYILCFAIIWFPIHIYAGNAMYSYALQAIQHDDAHSVACTIQHYPSCVHACDAEGNTLLLHALKHGAPCSVDTLLYHMTYDGHHFIERDYFNVLCAPNIHNETPLFYMLYYGVQYGRLQTCWATCISNVFYGIYKNIRGYTNNVPAFHLLVNTYIRALLMRHGFHWIHPIITPYQSSPLLTSGVVGVDGTIQVRIQISASFLHDILRNVEHIECLLFGAYHELGHCYQLVRKAQITHHRFHAGYITPGRPHHISDAELVRYATTLRMFQCGYDIKEADADIFAVKHFDNPWWLKRFVRRHEKQKFPPEMKSAGYLDGAQILSILCQREAHTQQYRTFS